jgi:hypothetical protein
MDKKNILLKQDRTLFHTNDLALLWNISNKNTLYTTIKRYIKDETLVPIHKGFYSTIPLARQDPLSLGISYLHTFAYVSTETILAREGIINQSLSYISLVSSQSKTFTLNTLSYRARQMKDVFLFSDSGLIFNKKFKEASLERAVADILYFNNTYHFDNRQLVDWDKVQHIQREVGFI